MTFSYAQLKTVAEILQSAARTEILPRFRQLASDQVRQKSSIHDVVTDADVAAEKVIADALVRRFPGAVVIGEEGVSADPSILGRLAGADLAFLVDPVDGTKNFASGLPLFGVMAAVVASGEVVGGVIYDPILDDFAFSLRGEGAWTESADGVTKDLRVASPCGISEMNGLVSWTALPSDMRRVVSANLPAFTASNSYRCAAHEYRMVCTGHADFLMHAKLMPWDHAAGVLMHREAGGYAARLDGSPYSPRYTEGGILCAADQTTWEAVHEALFRRPPSR